jgi:hypothetical protein
LTNHVTFRGVAAAILLAGLLLPAREPAHGQTSTLVVTVIDSGARYPLVNADVIDLSTGQHRFTDERGQARLAWPSDGQLRVRVRQVGYQPRQLTLRQANVSDGVNTFAMSRVAYVISTVKSTSRCATSADSASRELSMSELDQLKQAAEKYDQFRRLFPFEATVERRTAAIPPNGKVGRIVAAKEKFPSETWEAAYKPGDIIQYEFGGIFHVPLLFLSTLGDSVFWEHHCFIARGVESYQGARVVRLEFSPTADVAGPDYEGAALLDSATSHLLRVDFRLANPSQRKGPKRLEGYITFMSPSPFVMLPDTTTAIWWLRDVDSAKWGNPDVAQRLHLEELKYRKARPPGFEKAKQ